MADRSVEVVFRARIADYLRDLDRMGSATDRAADRVDHLGIRIDDVDRRTRDHTRSVDDLSNSVDRLGQRYGALNGALPTAGRGINDINRGFRSGVNDLDRYSGRLSWAIDGLLSLGPGLIPVGAVGVQALGGLAMSATAAAAAGGSALVAFTGVADAVKAIDAYQLDRTPQNLEKAQQAAARLGPDAQQFVMALQEAQPLLTDIRDAAAAGWMPGLTEALDEFDAVAPRIERLLGRAGEMGGFLTADAVESLGSGRWREEFSYFTNEIPAVMAALARATGDLVHGTAGLMQLMDSGSDSFLDWLEDVAQGYDEWAHSAEGAESINDILEYAEENGPKVSAMFGALAGALASVVRAAAPLGGPVLDTLTAVLNVVSGIADSDLGTPFLTALVGLRLYNRALQVTAATTATLGRANALAAMPGGVGLFGALTAQQRAQMTAAQVAQRQAAQRAAIMRGGILAAGTGLLATGAADDLGATNTAMGALLGTMIAPGWGTAAGVIAGGFLDMKAAAGQWGDELKSVQGEMDLTFDALAQRRQDIDALTGSIDEQRAWEQENAESYWQSLQSVVSDPVQSFQYLTGSQTSDSMTADQIAAGEEYRDVLQSIGMLQIELGGQNPFKGALGVDVATPKLADLEGTIARLIPGMEALGYEWQHLADPKVMAQVEQWIRRSDSGAGQMENLSNAIAGLGDESMTAAERAGMLGAALDQLMNPNLDAIAATDNWIRSIRALREQLTADGQADAGFRGRDALDNRSAALEYANAVKTRLVAMANAKASDEEMAKAVRASRREFIESSKAASVNGDEIAWMAKQMKLTPKLVEIVFKELGISKVDRQVWDLQRAFDQLPKKVQAEIRALGTDATKAEINEILKRYELAEKDRNALISLRDAASDKARALDRLLNEVTRPRSSTVTITYRHIGRQGTTPQQAAVDGTGADGNTVPKDGGPYSDRFLYMLAPGEEVISNRRGQADRHRPLLKAINAGLLADGGTATERAVNDIVFAGQATLPVATSPYANPLTTTQTAYYEALLASERALRKELAQRERREQKENDALKRRLDMYKAEREAVESSIRSRLTSDIWATKGPSGFELSRPDLVGLDPAARAAAEAAWGAVNGILPTTAAQTPEDILRADIEQAREMQDLIATLTERGLDDDALASLLGSASWDQIRSYAEGSQEALDLFETLFDQRQGLIDAAAGAGGQAAWGQEVAALRMDWKDSNAELKAIRRAAERGEKREERFERILKDIADNAPKETGREVGVVVAHELRRAVSNGVRGR